MGTEGREVEKKERVIMCLCVSVVCARACVYARVSARACLVQDGARSGEGAPLLVEGTSNVNVEKIRAFCKPWHDDVSLNLFPDLVRSQRLGVVVPMAQVNADNASTATMGGEEHGWQLHWQNQQ